jgi:hypothetical protein
LYIGNYGSPQFAYITQSNGLLFSAYGFATTNSSFLVNSTGDVECNSLKETSLKKYKHDIYIIDKPQL